jgi:SAM-dependent methyltransferase
MPPPLQHTPYDAEYFRMLRPRARSSAAVVAPLVVDLIAPKRVIDVGCGTGSWLRAFAALDCDVWGIDAAQVPEDLLEIPPSRFIERDLALPFEFTDTWDLAVSLEVAEHLAPSSAEAFVRGLAQLAPALLFSAAIPSQGGRHHVNEQWPTYWVELFSECGMVPIDCIRPVVWDDRRVAWWYAQNTLLFVEHTHLPDYPRLSSVAKERSSQVQSLVHPHLFMKLARAACEKAQSERSEANPL